LTPQLAGYNGPMRIVFVGPFAMQPKRTMAVRALPLARALAARGHEVLLVLPPWDHPQDAGWEWVEKGLRVYNVRLPLRAPVVFHIWLALRLVRACLQFGPEVVHCFKPKSYAGLAAWIFWQLKRMGLVKFRLVVDTDDWEGAGGWNQLQPYSWLQKRFFSWQERWGLTHCDDVTAASRSLETIVWSLGAARQRVHYLPNGAMARSQPQASHRAEELRRSLGLAGRPVALLYTRFFEFTLERAVAIMQGVLTAAPDARWLVVGKGLFGEEERLLALARQAGIADRVTYSGWVPAEQVPDYLALANVAVYPYDDTLVNRCKCAVKLIDLLSAGVPVVADRVGQNSEYIQDGVSGLLASPDDTAGFVAGAARLLRDSELAGSIGAAAAARMRDWFSWESLAETAEKSYLNLAPKSVA